MYILSTEFVLFAIHSLIAILMIIIGTIFHKEIIIFVPLSRNDINSAPSVTIAVGIIVLIFLTFFFLLRKMCKTEGFIMMSILFLIIISSTCIHAALKMTDKSTNMKKTLQLDIEYYFSKYNSTNNLNQIQSLLFIQAKMKCCGVTKPEDYKRYPLSCCPEYDVTNKTELYCKNLTTHYKDGCLNKIYNSIVETNTSLTYILIGFSILQILGTIYVIIRLNGVDEPCLPKLRIYENF